jgi:hypothetical protein
MVATGRGRSLGFSAQNDSSGDVTMRRHSTRNKDAQTGFDAIKDIVWPT